MSLGYYSPLDPITLSVASAIPALSFNRSDLANTVTLTHTSAGLITLSGTLAAAGFTSTGPISLSASQGLAIVSGAPGVTTDKLYQVGHSLYWNGSAIGGGSVTLTDDNTTNAAYYPVMATTAGGSTLKTSSSKISFNPSNGYLNIDGGLTSAGPVEGSTFIATGGGFTADVVTLNDLGTPSYGDLSLKSSSGNLYWNGTNLGGGISYATPAIRNKYLSSTASNTIAISVTAGDYIIVGLGFANSLATATCVDNASGGSNTYYQLGSGHFVANSGTTLYAFYAKAKATESLTVTVGDGGDTCERLCVHVVTGIASTSALDTYAWLTAEGALSTTHTGPSITTTNANDYLMTIWFNEVAGVTHTETGSGFTLQQQNNVMMTADRVVTSIGTYNDSITTTSSTYENGMIIALKAATATTSYMLNPMVNAGDMIIGGSGGNPLVLPKGTDTTILTMVAGVPAWASAGASSSPMTTLGDTTYYSTTPTRLAGNISTRQKMFVQTGTGTISAAPQWVNTPAVIVTGMDPSGATDSTAAINAAISALPTNGGTVMIPDPGVGGYYKFNLVIMKNGVNLIGPGLGPVDGTIGERSCRPYDTTKPVIQIGNDTVQVSGVSIENFSIYGAAVGQYGLFFAGGAYKCTARNIHIASFLTTHFAFTNADVVPCTFNNVYQLTIVNGSTPGTIGILYEDKHVSGNGWTTANNIIGFNVTCTYGYPVVIDSTADAGGRLVAGDIQTTISGHSIVYKSTYRTGASICYYGVGIDGISTGNYQVAVLAQVGCDPQSTGSSNIGNYPVVNGSLETNGKIFYVAGTVATCSIPASSSTLTVSSATNMLPGRYVAIPGAGTSYTLFIAKILSVSGTTVTLDKVSVNQSGNISALGVYTAGNVTIQYGDVTGIEGPSNSRTVATSLNFNPIIGKNGFNNDSCLMYRSDGYGTITPWNGNDVILDLGANDFNVFFAMSNMTPSSVTQSGTTVTVTCPGSHYLAVGDFFALEGATLKDGINGTWRVSTWVSSTVFQFTSTATFTGTITGTFNLRRYHLNYFDSANGTFNIGHLGIQMRNQTGAYQTVLSHDVSSANTYFWTGDQANGIMNIVTGTGITTGNSLNIGDASAGAVFSLTGNGVHKFLPAPAPATDSSFGQLWYSDSDSRFHSKTISGLETVLGGVIWSKTSTTTLASFTTAATIIGAVGTGVGTLTLPANFLSPGKTVRIRLKGTIGDTTTAPTYTLAVTLGGVSLGTTGAITLVGTSLSNRTWEMDFTFTCRTAGSSGTVFGGGLWVWSQSTTATAIGQAAIGALASSTVNTTTSLAINVTLACGTSNAANTASCMVGTVEVLN